MTDTIAILGSPTALGGHFAGMDKGPSALRGVNLIERLRGRKGLAGASFVDYGDVPIEAGWAPDPDPIMKNWQRIVDYLPVLASRVEEVMVAGGTAGRFSAIVPGWTFSKGSNLVFRRIDR